MPTVAENGDEEDDEVEAEASANEDGQDDEKNEIPDLPKHSPGNLSQVSGTTTFSNTTSFSVKAMADIHHSAAERLPELYTSALNILELLAPPNASQDQVESIFRDLKISGSEQAESLKEAEDNFKQVRDLYGVRETYIRVDYILRKLLGTTTPSEGPYRPDALIYVANLATMVKEFLVYEQHSVTIHAALLDLEDFPRSFLASFEDVVHYGSSSKKFLKETFELFLEIKTQSTIAVLKDAKEQDDFSPEDILATQFYEEPEELTEGMAYLDDLMKNGEPRQLSSNKTVKDEGFFVETRVKAIFSAFREGEDAQDAADVVDFEMLEEMFPWMDFLTKLVNWSRKRLVETSRAAEQQGGHESITKEFLQMTSRDSTSSRLLSAAEISQIK